MSSGRLGMERCYSSAVQERATIRETQGLCCNSCILLTYKQEQWFSFTNGHMTKLFSFHGALARVQAMASPLLCS